jgi:hypothetical protein
MGTDFSLVLQPYGARVPGLASQLMAVGLRRAEVGRRLSQGRALAYTYSYENL